MACYRSVAGQCRPRGHGPSINYWGGYIVSAGPHRTPINATGDPAHFRSFRETLCRHMGITQLARSPAIFVDSPSVRIMLRRIQILLRVPPMWDIKATQAS
ncbi:small subunit of acetolactate synthase domain-containing protein [Rhizoctonia solani AG-1 IA]|uniref:Small subunit of acetolactate synthase domain-containing protein n=1 Tax=Thanatephorus cucumeris (strain AG1-IA) TaxID=983506 RepID=L8WZE3_THACA|nr:small subunit of acetolactate synthase domain-containing protein [Rhizoctonia solani AG-1 IA]